MIKKRKLNIFIVVLMALSLVWGALSASYGATAASKKKEAEEAGKKAAEAVENYEEAAERLEEIQKEIEQTKKDIEVSKKRIKKKEKQIEKQEEALGDRLTAMYKTGTVGYIDVILSSDNIPDLISNFGMVQKILKNDQKLLKEMEDDLAELKEMKAELKEQKESLEVKEAETKALKDKYQKEADEWKAKEEELMRESQELAAEANANAGSAEKRIIDNGGSIDTSNYAWPTKSNYIITSTYGWRVCPFHGNEFHDGLDICLTSGTNGSPVYAINDGIITRASKYYGYGNCITLSCGGNISALYGHLKGYNCKKDQFVKRGDVIGYIGSTGNSTGPHLHFMIFKNGTTISPYSIY